MKYDVNTLNDFGYVHSAIVNGELVEVARKDVVPPFATVDASSLTNALAEARRRYGHNVIVSEQGGRILTHTTA